MSQNRHELTAPTFSGRYEAGDVIERHRHDGHQLIYVSAGVLAIRNARGNWVASRDQAVWVPEGTWHEHRYYGRTSLHTVGFTTEHAPLHSDSPIIVAVDGLLRELIVACAESDLTQAESARLKAVLTDRLHRAEIQTFTLPVARDPRLADTCRLVEDDLRQPRSLSWLARRTGTSERTLTRLFRAEFGTTYPQWRTDVRVCRAMILLAEGASVTEAGHACGWVTTSAFCATFVRVMGQTPGRYRDGRNIG